MSFTLDPGLNHIDTPETCVIEMYRSATPVRMTDARFRGNPCEAFICLTSVDKVPKASVALIETGMNGVFVYTSDVKAPDLSAAMAEAMEFVTGLGFSMERINLDFSPAMREVIIKGLKVMRQPRKAQVRHARHLGKAEIPVHPPEPPLPSVTSEDSGEQNSLQLEIAAMKQELAAAKVMIQSMNQENSSLASGMAKESVMLKKSILALENDNKTLRRQLADAQAATAQEIASLQLENNRLAENLAVAAAANTAAVDKIAALKLFETSWKEGQQREEELCRNIDMLQEQNVRLAIELEDKAATASEKQELLERIAILEQDAAASKAESEQLRRDGAQSAAAEIRALAAAKMDIETEYIRLANERREKEEEMLEALYGAEQEIMRLTAELENRRPTAAFQQEQPTPTRTEPLPVDETPPPSAPPPAPAEIAIIAASEEEPDLPIAGDPNVIRGLMNEFGGFTGSSGELSLNFTIVPSMSAIEYSSPAEIIALIYSCNSIQAAPNGTGTQRCRGYVVALKKIDRYFIYTAWYLPESQRTIVCAPDQQPADSADCTRILREAVAYFEIVGFMMEFEDLGNSVSTYNSALKKTPVLRRVS